MTLIRKIDYNLWEGPKMFDFTPHFMRTEYAREYYPNGASLLHDPVHPGNKKIPLVLKKSEDLKDAFGGYSSGGHKDYVDMRINSVANRSGFFYMGLFCLFIWWIFDIFALSAAPPSFKVFNQILRYGGYGIGAAITFIPLFRTLATPVRFHKKNQEVYVYHKKVLYRIPWDECEFSIRIAKQNEGYRGLQDGYQLSLWLSSVHATNLAFDEQQHVELNMIHCMRIHAPAYAYWEYVRRYMTGDTPVYTEISKKRISPQPTLDIELVLWLLLLPVSILCMPHFYALATPFRCRWPKEVHEWTGEKCNWN